MRTKIKLLIIGKNSFISNFLYSFLKKKITIKKISYELFQQYNESNLKKFSHICNCSIKKEYQQKKYEIKNDIDLNIVKKIKNLNIKYIFLSSRKIYKPADNIKENSKISPLCNYSRNKFITEKKIVNYIPRKYLILRISNIIGKVRKKLKKRRISKIFIENFFIYKKRKKKIYYENFYKDFISEKQFSEIFYNMINKNLYGIYNISLGEKVYISEIISALCKGEKNIFYKVQPKLNDNFFLNNKKLLKKIPLKIKKKDLLDYCYKVGTNKA